MSDCCRFRSRGPFDGGLVLEGTQPAEEETYLDVLGTQVDVGSQQQLGVLCGQIK